MGPLSGLSVVAHYVSPPYKTDRQTHTDHPMTRCVEIVSI